MARNLANSLESLSSDIFTEYIRFLFELIQNADDAEARNVAIRVLPEHIVIAHDGKAFTEADVEAICSIGEGTKKADSTKTGYKGIGFKSVFGKSKHVAVFTDGFQFKFTDTFRHPSFAETKMPWQIIPVWAEREEYPDAAFDLPGGTEWHVITVIALKSTGQLNTDLEELIGNGEFLLFLRALEKITVAGSRPMEIERVRGKGTEAYDEVTIKKDGQVTSQWIPTPSGTSP
ncbi:MAG TPA: ATP-binding protein [Flavobacteriales bacterium]|nr:ATP-binding protein [Flavobacteriales bacterium]